MFLVILIFNPTALTYSFIYLIYCTSLAFSGYSIVFSKTLLVMLCLTFIMVIFFSYIFEYVELLINLNNNGNYGHQCFGPDFKGKALVLTDLNDRYSWSLANHF